MKEREYAYVSKVILKVSKVCEVIQPHEVKNNITGITYTVVPAVRIKGSDELIAVDDLMKSRHGMELDDIEYIGLEYYREE